MLLDDSGNLIHMVTLQESTVAFVTQTWVSGGDGLQSLLAGLPQNHSLVDFGSCR